MGVEDDARYRQQGEPNQSPREGGAGQLMAVSNLLAEKGLFTRYTPKGEDPTWYPIDVMDELQSDLDRRAQRAGQDTTRAEKFASRKQAMQKVQMAYEIIAFPRFDGRHREQAGMELALDRMQNGPNNAPGELNDEERSILGRLALARGLPFNPEKRAYRYIELYILCQAEHIVDQSQDSVSE